MDMFSALLGKSLSGGGGSEPVLVSKSISANGTYDPSDDNADGYSSVTVNVPNSYTAADEGKVVSNGELVSQTSSTVTQNGTVDTTLINSLVVNVSAGAGTAVKLTTTDSNVSDSDLYLIDTGRYIYLFGYVINTYLSSLSISFNVPDDFDMSSIGSSYGFGWSIYHSNGSGSTHYTEFLSQSKTAQVFCWQGQTDILQMWNRAT